MVKQRKKGVKITDERIRLITEVLHGIRLIKSFAWEDFYSHRIGTLRSREIKTIKIAAIARGLLFALIMFIPVLASTLSFVVNSTILECAA
jgi:ATP-binding cassette subfamily C (CFTR/MRP) protein 1